MSSPIGKQGQAGRPEIGLPPQQENQPKESKGFLEKVKNVIKTVANFFGINTSSQAKANVSSSRFSASEEIKSIREGTEGLASKGVENVASVERSKMAAVKSPEMEDAEYFLNRIESFEDRKGLGVETGDTHHSVVEKNGQYFIKTETFMVMSKRHRALFGKDKIELIGSNPADVSISEKQVKGFARKGRELKAKDAEESKRQEALLQPKTKIVAWETRSGQQVVSALKTESEAKTLNETLQSKGYGSRVVESNKNPGQFRVVIDLNSMMKSIKPEVKLRLALENIDLRKFEKLKVHGSTAPPTASYNKSEDTYTLEFQNVFYGAPSKIRTITAAEMEKYALSGLENRIKNGEDLH